MSELLTATEIVMRRGGNIAPHPIPPITDPMGQYWDQPSRFDIEIDETHALMSQATFDALHNYAHSVPTGCYPGKMWKWWRPGEHPTAYLKWYGATYFKDGTEYCSGHTRKILIV